MLSFYVAMAHLEPGSVICPDWAPHLVACAESAKAVCVQEYFIEYERMLSHQVTPYAKFRVYPTITAYVRDVSRAQNYGCMCMGCAVIATDTKQDFSHTLWERGMPCD